MEGKKNHGLRTNLSCPDSSGGNSCGTGGDCHSNSIHVWVGSLNLCVKVSHKNILILFYAILKLFSSNDTLSSLF